MREDLRNHQQTQQKKMLMHHRQDLRHLCASTSKTTGSSDNGTSPELEENTGIDLNGLENQAPLNYRAGTAVLGHRKRSCSTGTDIDATSDMTLTLTDLALTLALTDTGRQW